MVHLDLADIQGNILNGYPFERAMHMFCSVRDAARGREFLQRLLDDGIQNAELWKTPPEAVVNVALTFAGLERLGVEDAVLRELPDEFREPIRRRAERVLGDTGDDAPRDWNLDTSESHILVLVAGSANTLDRKVADVCDHAKKCGVTVGPCQRAQALENQREHFGWADGFGQPAVEGAPTIPNKESRRVGQGVPLEDGITWRDLKAGEFILGYPDEDEQTLSGRKAPLLHNGTYLVYRKLEQDAKGFEEHLSEEARRYRDAVNLPGSEEHAYEVLAAKIVGRWRDGAALSILEDRTPEETVHLDKVAYENPDNDFRYAQLDASGHICPRGAHIRRTNPRDGLVGGGKLSRRHRIIRRGMPYDDTDEGRGLGLIFICFNADIKRQFEFVLTQWCNDGNAFWLGRDRDFFVGADGSDKMAIEGDRPFLLKRRQFVFTRGCQYLLMPGLNALEDIVTGRRGLARSDV